MYGSMILVRKRQRALSCYAILTIPFSLEIGGSRRILAKILCDPPGIGMFAHLESQCVQGILSSNTVNRSEWCSPPADSLVEMELSN